MAMTDATRHGNALPSLSYIDLDKIKKENSFYNARIPSSTAANVPAPALVSPSSMYSGPPPPYSYPSSTASSVANGYTNGYISPPSEPRKPLDIEKDQQQVGRQSLPSIHEALNRDQPLSITSLLTETSAPPSHPAQRASNNSPTSPSYRSYRDFPSSAPAVTPSQTQPSPSHPEPSSRQHHSPPRLVYDPNSSRGPSSATRENHYSTMLPPRTVPSPATTTRPPMPSSTLHHPSPAYESISRPAPILNPHNYGPHPAPYPYPPVMPTIASSFQPPSPSSSVNWRHNDRDRPDDDYGRNGGLKEHVMKPTYGEAVKRHLDNFDLETSLNEIAEGGGRAIEFSSRYGNRAFLTQRSGPIPGSIPTLAECDEIMNHQKRVLDSMQSIKEIIVAQQHALAEQRNYEINHKPSSDADEDGASFGDKLEGSGGFAGADTKKRRGRAAPPGRCHSCNRAETPEWRRGPDGARTLCNACGLHYAKLTRKLGPKASSTGSNLRPKEASQGSP
ncbi:MAG: hypothetical protein Q9194_001548 [Teloschistes cf. exilis]